MKKFKGPYGRVASRKSKITFQIHEPYEEFDDETGDPITEQIETAFALQRIIFSDEEAARKAAEDYEIVTAGVP